VDFLKIDKGNLSRIVNKIESAGCLQCISHGRSKFYAATKKPFDFKSVKELYKTTTGKIQRLHGGCSLIQIQGATFKCKILGKINRPPRSWDKEWDHNGLYHQMYQYPFQELNGATVTFIRDHSSIKNLLKIKLPRIDWVITEVHPEEYLCEISKKLAVWFQKHFKVKLDIAGMEKSGKIEYAHVLRDPDLINAAHNDNYKVGEVWIDTSKPHELAELESNSYHVIKTIAELEDRSSAYNDIKYLKAEMNELKGIVRDLAENQKQIMEMMRDLMVAPTFPDSFRDVV